MILIDSLCSTNSGNSESHTIIFFNTEDAFTKLTSGKLKLGDKVHAAGRKAHEEAKVRISNHILEKIIDY